MQGTEQVKIYWEKQDSDLLCAVHALNSLMQYPCWDSVSLASLAREIDSEEQLILKEHIDRSQNVSESGYYSIQVITRALSSKGLEMNYFNLSNSPTEEQAFVCNFRSHWISLRKIKGDWYNLNSLSEGPEWIGELYLSAMIYQIKSEGYTIFSIRGTFPDIQYYGALYPYQKLVPVNLIKFNRNTNNREQEDKELNDAIAMSLNEAGDDDELNKAIALSLNIDIGIENSHKSLEKYAQIVVNEYTGPDTFVIRLKCLDGKIISKPFLPGCKFEEVAGWAASQIKQDVRLVSSFPRKIYSELDATIKELGLDSSNNLLIAEKVL
jgi:Ataxin-3